MSTCPDCRVAYLDAARSVAWDFQNVAASLRRDDDVLTLEASASPPIEFADRIELTAQAVVGADTASGARFTGDWRLSADVDVTVSVPPDRVGELAAALAAEGFRPLVKGSSSPARSASRATTHWRCGLANSTARSTVVSTTATAPT